jgi:hypothetical protein
VPPVARRDAVERDLQPPHVDAVDAEGAALLGVEHDEAPPRREERGRLVPDAEGEAVRARELLAEGVADVAREGDGVGRAAALLSLDVDFVADEADLRAGNPRRDLDVRVFELLRVELVVEVEAEQGGGRAAVVVVSAALGALDAQRRVGLEGERLPRLGHARAFGRRRARREVYVDLRARRQRVLRRAVGPHRAQREPAPRLRVLDEPAHLLVGGYLLGGGLAQSKPLRGRLKAEQAEQPRGVNALVEL